MHDAFTYAIRLANGTLSLATVTVNILGTNDAAVLSADTKNLTETNAALSTGGTLTISDVDSSATFVAQAATAGTYGSFAIDAAGAWTYTASSAHDAFVAGTTYTDTFAVASADGTATSVTVSILGTNDAAVITGTSTASLTETDAVLSTSGDLNASDVDSSAAFVAQTDAAGSNGYGKFSIDDTGAWTYTANTAHNEFVGGTTYTDSVTVATADGTTQVLTVSILGTNDAAVITGTASDAVTEASGVLNGTAGDASASGDLNATDVDSSADFVVQSGVAKTYGTFSIDTSGAWSYTLDDDNAAVQALNTSSTPLTETVTVATADGTIKDVTITINGANDAPVITAPNSGNAVALNVAENTANTTAVVDVNATDVDGDTITYSLSGADATLFSIVASTGVVTFTSAPNFEAPADSNADNVYNFTVTATDNGTGSLTDTQAFAITVTDVAEGTATGPTGVNFTLTSLQGNGNGLPSSGTVLGNFTAVDADGGTFTFTETADTVGGNAGNTFSIDSTTGQVTLNSDLSASTTYGVTVQVTDELLRTASETLVVKTGGGGGRHTQWRLAHRPPVRSCRDRLSFRRWRQRHSAGREWHELLAWRSGG